MNFLGNISVVRSAHAITAEKVFNLVDNGSLLWVFDFASGGSSRRELRFWVHEIGNPKQAASLTLEGVIDSILPPARISFGATEMRRLFSLGRASGWRLAKRLGKRNSAGHWRVQRAALVNFLRQRWIGGRA